ncbi:hypothetical protein K2Q00_03795 [Patescibacteria group bacterium]|nr:hypothetical protein [Patescibacteria group bacterium]
MQETATRPFQISCGLREGYEESATTHTPAETREVIQQWIAQRLQEIKPVIAGTLIVGEFIYPWTEGSATSSRFEPAIHFKGQVREDVSDSEAKEMLTDLATKLAKTFSQKRVHVEFCNTYWIVEI